MKLTELQQKKVDALLTTWALEIEAKHTSENPDLWALAEQLRNVMETTFCKDVVAIAKQKVFESPEAAEEMMSLAV